MQIKRQNQTGARFIARISGTLENQYADDIRTDGKESDLIRVSKNVVKRKSTSGKAARTAIKIRTF